MRRTVRILCVWMMIAMLISLAAACDMQDETEANSLQNEGDDEMKGTQLHYILPDSFEHQLIGDVHPYYHEESETWYMFYLDTSGQFNTRLLTSKDGLNWLPTELKLKSNMHNYPVLNIVEDDGRYFSYYAEYIPSVSDNLLEWDYPGLKYMIPLDTKQFPGGMRDPSVAYDPDSKRYYSIGLSYTKRVASENIYLSNLSINHTSDDSLTTWVNDHKKVFREDLVSHDPEVPQLVKIGDRWYVITSLFGYTQHGVGPTSYLIGDPGLNPSEVDWQSKELHVLTSEDLAAAQITAYKDKHLIFGWIPKDYTGNTWGGHINLPLEVYARENGTLATRLFSEISELIRGQLIQEQIAAVSLSDDEHFMLDTEKRFDLEFQFSLEDRSALQLNLPDNKVEVNVYNQGSDSYIEIKSNTFTTSKLQLASDGLQEINRLRVIAEGNMLEVFLNDEYTVHSRIGMNMLSDQLIFKVREGNAQLSDLQLYRLNYLEELYE